MADYLLTLVEPKKNILGRKKNVRAYGSKDQLMSAANDYIKQGYFISDVKMTGCDTSLTLTKKENNDKDDERKKNELFP
ncbi:MAG: hypothetical protein KRP56_03070 [Candidatus Methanogranum gryphiswaldense]|nr:MAG: hypothetical protein KRP56_03070 [Candidatus Methanogranum sp. U3.2.1]